MKLKRIILTTCVLTTLAQISFGQEKLDTTTVSATRIQTSYKETGKTVTVITAKEIDKLPVNTVEDLLQNVAGINLNARAGFGVQTDIGLRGSTFSQVLILIDNQRLNDGLTAHFNNNIPIALSEIEQIEVIKGPSGMSYGSDAVGGVIHIKTKTYMADKRYAIDFSGKASKGQYKLNNHDMGFFLNTKKWAFSIARKSLNSDGQEFLNPNFAPGNGDSTYKTYFDLKNYTISGAYMKDNWKFYLRGAMDMRDFNAKYFYTASSFDESTEQVKAYWAQSAIINQGEKFHTEFNIGYKHNQDTFVFNPNFPANGHTTTRLNATLTQNLKLNQTRIAYGLQYDQTGIESSDRGDHSNYSIAAFAQSRFKLTNRFVFLAGVRVENDDYFGLQFVPQITGTYVLPKLVIRSSIGQSIRNADYTERFVSYNIQNLSPNRNAGNPDVEPEKSLSADLNFDWKIKEGFRLSQSVFYRKSNNLIDYVLTNSNNITNLTNLQADTTYFYTQNIAESQTYGYELSGSYDFFNTDSTLLRLMVDYTYLNTTNSGDEVSKYIANHPVHSVAPRVIFRYNRIRFSATTNFITRNPEVVQSIDGEIKESYFLLNARVSYQPKYFPGRIFIEGRNILDTQYQEILGSRMPGQWVYAGVTWKWRYKKGKAPVSI